MGLHKNYDDGHSFSEFGYEEENIEDLEPLDESDKKKRIRRMIEERLERKRLQKELQDEFDDEFDWTEWER
ncbi:MULTISPECIES: PA3496 family putative envelope integrity protein [Legionella]|uniref:Uncharacterized protein n=1 Tax=Legionella septentrionalis TaxID=2498109 RepID=A0A3S0V9U5_9GAMM|nr:MULTISPECIES: hypothetical protein [Legionella]MCP0913632.1 hypothetical protein [Legionella sp. 27cVA30]RUQ81639.1 hypothetical protein EKM59_09955 [Legionella septentrionalis]RUQ96340.1 hypothetical protein ELY11_08150 [Legionella septentrionalis]RUR09087.1 hypothetical protein ELY14_09730 [Legionella septentrionalis]RUR14148.1 hypothetical protein ELY10_09250 [Legionella septentrionalis]